MGRGVDHRMAPINFSRWGENLCKTLHAHLYCASSTAQLLKRVTESRHKWNIDMLGYKNTSEGICETFQYQGKLFNFHRSILFVEQDLDVGGCSKFWSKLEQRILPLGSWCIFRWSSVGDLKVLKQMKIIVHIIHMQAKKNTHLSMLSEFSLNIVQYMQWKQCRDCYQFLNFIKICPCITINVNHSHLLIFCFSHGFSIDVTSEVLITFFKVLHSH